MDEIRAQLMELRNPTTVVADADGPPDEAIQKALETLLTVPAGRFPNAHDELRAFLTHPEVRTFADLHV
jgi:hypothetical protein